MPAMIDGATYTVAGVRKPPRNEPAGDDRRRRRGLGYGDYMSGGTVKPDFWALFHFHPFF
jgi:hypothetical protein